MKDFIKAVAIEVGCIICRILKLGIVVSLVAIGTLMGIIVAVVNYLHIAVTWFTIWTCRKISSQETGEDYNPELEDSIKHAMSCCAVAYEAVVETFDMIQESETDFENSEEDEEA